MISFLQKALIWLVRERISKPKQEEAVGGSDLGLANGFIAWALRPKEDSCRGLPLSRKLTFSEVQGTDRLAL